MAYELFFDGFDTYSSDVEMLKYGYLIAPILVANAGRRNGKAVAGRDAVISRQFSNSTHVVTGIALKVNTWARIDFRNGTTVHASLKLTANSTANLSVGGNPELSSNTLFPYGTYMFVELGVSIGNAGIGTYEVRINGSNVGWFPLTVADTQNGSTVNVNNIVIVSEYYNMTHMDDFYLAYGDELAWKGDSRMDRILLSGNATPQDWTPDTGNAWERLNAGTGYVESATDEASSLFTVADLGYNPLALHGVKVAGLVKKSDAGYREACVLLKSGATTAEGTATALSTDTLSLTNILKTDPSTGAAWSLPAVQALEAGLRVKA